MTAKYNVADKLSTFKPFSVICEAFFIVGAL